MLKLFLAALLAVTVMPAQAATYVKITGSGPAGGIFQEGDGSFTNFNGWGTVEAVIPLDGPYYCEAFVTCGWSGNKFSMTLEMTKYYVSMDLTFAERQPGVPTSTTGFLYGSFGGYADIDNRPPPYFSSGHYAFGDITNLSITVLEGEAYGTVRVNVAGWVPEPATWVMMIAGFGLLGGALRRQQRATVAFA